MNWSPKPHTLLLLVAVAALGTPLILSADMLVLTEGSSITTKGPWQIDGRRVLYTNQGGNLAAVRLSNVDLEASRAATAARNSPPQAVTPVQRHQTAAVVLEDKDCGDSNGQAMSLEKLFTSDERLAREIWGLSNVYAMDTEAGIIQAQSSLEALAGNWRQQASLATGQESLHKKDMASTAEALAKLARDQPAEFARRWPKESP